MGLDVSVYSQVQFSHRCQIRKGCQKESLHSGHEHFLIYPGDSIFRRRLDGRHIGCYEYVGSSMRFSMGTCTNYNLFRRVLCLMFVGVEPEVVWKNLRKYQHRPLYRLIQMADNEGAFGPNTSRRLAADFEKHRPQLEERLRATVASITTDKGKPAWGEYEFAIFHEMYENLRQGFALASDGGFVKFH